VKATQHLSPALYAARDSDVGFSHVISNNSQIINDEIAREEKGQMEKNESKDY